MINFFQSSYDAIFLNWYELRKELTDKSTEIKCIEIDKWWQKAPLVNHYLTTENLDNWPNPWELLSENHYCQIARGLGMFYTLHLLDVKEIDFVMAKDYNDEIVPLIIVENAKYILNYWPDTVLNNCLKDFKIIKKIDTAEIIKKIGMK